MAIDSYLNLITSQHRNKPNFIAWLSAALNKVDDGITATNSIPSVFAISGAKLGTTNLVKNSGVEIVTQTATLFSDALTSYTGSIVPAPWTLQSGSFTFGASGATSSATKSVMYAGNTNWKPLLGSDGTTKLVLTTQATFTQGTTLGWTQFFLRIDSSNFYVVKTNGSGGMMYLSKSVSGTGTDLASVAQTFTASTAYTITLSLDNTGALTAKLYQGTSTTGTLLQTLTATDTSLTGGFSIGVGGDTGVVISNASCVGPWANSWNIAGDSRVAWGLTQSAIGGKYSLSAVGVALKSGYVFQNSNVSGNASYTLSSYLNTISIGSNGVNLALDWQSSGTSGHISTSSSSLIVGTTSTERVSLTATSPSNATGVYMYLYINDSGTVTFDNIQLEQGSTETNYVDNPSLSYPASTYSDQLNIIGQSIGADRDVGVQLSTGTSILDDAHYQTYLNAKISANQWDGTTPGLYKIWSSVFPVSSLKITDNQDMTISLTISGITDSVVEEMINDGLIIPKPMGVKISSITFGTVLIYNKLDTQTWNTVQTYTWDQLEMQSF